MSYDIHVRYDGGERLHKDARYAYEPPVFVVIEEGRTTHYSISHMYWIEVSPHTDAPPETTARPDGWLDPAMR